MAGAPVPMIHCWRLKIERLSLYLASTQRGAKRVKLSVDTKTPILEFFQLLFPESALVLSREWNEPLIAAVEASLAGGSPPASLQMDITLSPFQDRVLCTIARIPFGSTLSYSEVAAALGSPTLARAVGQALKRNPLPIIFPCHRVVAIKGIGGFGGKSPENLEVKRYLLKRESSVEIS